MSPTMNRVIPVVGGIVVLIALAVGIGALKKRSAPSDAGAPMTALPVTPAPDADSPADTVRSLSAQVAELVAQTSTLTDENRLLRERNAELSAQERRIEDRLRASLEQNMNTRASRERDVLSALTARVERLAGSVAAQPAPAPRRGGGAGAGSASGTAPGADGWGDIPVGFGYDTGVGAIHWIEPIDAAPGAPGVPATPPVPGSLLHTGSRALERAGDGAGAVSEGLGQRLAGAAERMGERALEPPQPVYTIPANATLDRSTTFTALVGRVPVGGQVQDAMPFKVLIGADNLAANGHRIPGLEGMVVSGYAVGDWTLSCVRGTVTSATFVFEDGHIVTFGGPAQGKSDSKKDEQLGWISDRFGVPCVTGERITNAPEFLSQRIGMTALQAAAAAAAAAQTTTVIGTDATSSTSVTGDQDQYILGQTVASGADEVNRWLLERQAQSFDAIFVAAGQPVAVHLDVTLPVDYQPGGRQIDHRARLTQGGLHGPLD